MSLVQEETVMLPKPPKEKKEKKERKEKKEKKAKKSKQALEAPAVVAEDEVSVEEPAPPRRKKSEKASRASKKEKPSDDVSDGSESDSPEEERKTSKKRKRDTEPIDELEVDLSLPTPPSKKALRKAKKNSTKAGTGENGEGAGEGAKNKIAAGAEDAPQKRSEHGVWIGNLAWSVTKEGLRKFLTSNSEIKDDEITRVHMPKPKPNAQQQLRIKPNNNGYAYVDFSTAATMWTALELSETALDGRKVLIKNAKSFEGRPEKPKAATEAIVNGKPPNKRIFVGNLSFDVTRDDLFEHFAPCGQVDDVFLASFEDSGKCKGYGWVTFADIPAAEAAVRGFALIEPQASGPEDEEDQDAKPEWKRKTKPRKWFVSKIQGRPLRCEFAEDASTRYKKRYGKDKPAEE